MPRPKLHDDALRMRLLDRAARLLSDDGPDSLSLRRLATESGTSTTAVYSLFGGKPALLRAVYDEALRRLGERLDAVEPTDDPAADLAAMAAAYRAGALDDPHLYAVMFGRRPAGQQPAAGVTERAIAPVVDAMRRAVDAGIAPKEDPLTLATAWWAAAHGLAALEIGGLLSPAAGDPAELVTACAAAVARGWDRVPG